MAKKSAKSKGYRKAVKKKPFLTKKEIIALVVIVAVILVGIVLFNLLYDDGFISASQIQPNDVISYASRESRSRFAKVGVANELDGFTRTDPDRSEAPAGGYSYTPDAETDHIESIRVSGSFIGAEQLASNSVSQLSALLSSSSYEATSVVPITVQGHDAYVFSYTANYYEEPTGEESAEAEESAEEVEPAEAEEPAEEVEPAEAEEPAEEVEPESNVYTQTLSCYVDVDGFTLCFDIYRRGEDDSYYLPEDQIVDYMLNYAGAFTVVDRDAK